MVGFLGNIKRIRHSSKVLRMYISELQTVHDNNIMCNGNAASIGRFYDILCEAEEGPVTMFKTLALRGYFAEKLVKLVEHCNSDCHHILLDPKPLRFEQQRHVIDTQFRFSPSSMLHLSRERSLMTETLAQQDALRMKLLAGVLSFVFWLITNGVSRIDQLSGNSSFSD